MRPRESPTTVAAPDRGVLLERADELAALDELLRAVRAGRGGRIALIAGEAGIGKSSVVRAFCERWPSVRTLWGGCDALATPRALGPFVDIGEVASPEFAAIVKQGASPATVAAALTADARGELTVLVLEDLHWADEATLDVVRLLARKVDGARMLVALTYRDDQLHGRHPLQIALGDLPVRAIKRFRLSPLSVAAVEQMATESTVDAGELHVRTAGNPFFLTEVLAAGGGAVPATVRDAVLSRAARLDGPSRAVLDAVAIEPERAELWLLEDVLEGLSSGLDVCISTGMLRAEGHAVTFRHEIARVAVEEALLPHQRMLLHRRALAALAAATARRPDLARLAYHAEAADDTDAVLQWAPQAAARAASAGAHREAAAQYARALRFADGWAPEHRAELLQRRADECYMSDQLDAAVTAQEDALGCRRQAGDPRGEADALRSLSRLLFFAGRVSDAEPLVLEAVKQLERLPPGHELVMAYGNVSQRRMVVEDTNDALAWGARALELAQRLDDTEGLVYALTNIGAAELQAGRQDGEAKVERALVLAQRHDLEEYAGRAFCQLVHTGVRRCMRELSDRHLEAGLAYCGDRGLDTWRLYLLASRARLELDLGRWNAAGESAGLVLRDPRSATVPRGWALTTLGLLRARRGDPGAAGPLLEAHALGHATAELTRIGQVAAARAEAAWLSGDSAAVEPLTHDALVLARHRAADWDLGELSYWRWQAGSRDPGPVISQATPYDLSLGGEHERAAERWEALGRPYEAALALAESDDLSAAREAIDRLQDLGARPAGAVIARRLRERGVRGLRHGPRRQTRQNPAGLTARELEVVALVAEGLRDKEIADRLFMAPRTAGHHVAAILRKLNATTRSQAAAEAARLGIIPRA